MTTSLPTSPARILCRYGFFFSLVFFFYGTLYPFQFDFSPRELSWGWSHAGWQPYWDVARGRIPSVPDAVANILLTFPIGFCGYLHYAGQRRRLWQWLIFGLALGATAELLQLAVPSRSSSITDALNNGIGAFAGAAVASMIGASLFEFLEGNAWDVPLRHWGLLAAALVAIMLSPFDFGIDVSRILWNLRSLRHNPWHWGVPVGDGWIQAAAFALVGAMSGKLAKGGRLFRLSIPMAALAAILLLPLALELAQLLCGLHSFSLRSMTVEVSASLAGFALGMTGSPLARPGAGLILVSMSLVAAGLSPGHFVSWEARSGFGWIPFVAYYHQTTPAALYDAIMGLTCYGLTGGLLQISCGRCPRSLAVVYAIALATGIEICQCMIPTRFADITDILIAGMGAWIGALLCSSLAAVSRRPTES